MSHSERTDNVWYGMNDFDDAFGSLENIQRWNEQHNPPSQPRNDLAGTQMESHNHQIDDHDASVGHSSAEAWQRDENDPLPEAEGEVEDGEEADSKPNKRALKQGKVRYVNGDLEHLLGGTRWVPASYHHKLREEILQDNPPTAYDVRPARGPGPLDQTSFWEPHKSLDFESRDSYPDIVLQWIPPPSKCNAKVNPLKYKGRYVIDFQNRIVKDFNMPFALSSNLEGSRLEYISRTNALSPSKADFAARMPVEKDAKGKLKPLMVANAVGMKKLRFRNLNALVPSETRACSLDRKKALVQCIPQDIMAQILVRNSTRPWRTTTPLERAYLEAPNRGKHLEKAGKDKLETSERKYRHEMEDKKMRKFAPPNLPAWPYGDNIENDAAAVEVARRSLGLPPDNLTASQPSKLVAAARPHGDTADKKRGRDVVDNTAAEYVSDSQGKRRRLQHMDTLSALDNSGTAREETSSRTRPTPQSGPRNAFRSNNRSDRPRTHEDSFSRLPRLDEDMPGQDNSLPYGYEGVQGQAPTSMTSSRANIQAFAQAGAADRNDRSAQQSVPNGWIPTNHFGNPEYYGRDFEHFSADWAQPSATLQGSYHHPYVGGISNNSGRPSIASGYASTQLNRSSGYPGIGQQPWDTDSSYQGGLTPSYALPSRTQNRGPANPHAPRQPPSSAFRMSTHQGLPGHSQGFHMGRSPGGQAGHRPVLDSMVGHPNGPEYSVWTPMDISTRNHGNRDQGSFHSSHGTIQPPQAVHEGLARADRQQVDHMMPSALPLAREPRIEGLGSRQPTNPINHTAVSSALNADRQFPRPIAPSERVDSGIRPFDHVQNSVDSLEYPGLEDLSHGMSSPQPPVNQEPIATEDMSDLLCKDFSFESIFAMSREELESTSREGGWIE
ncbi:MAG: hypothetical protein Q9174_000951 [Haloplaca sp. 1 TL-2023]